MQTFVRGDRILLKAGDTFSGQFVPNGNGIFDLGVFNTTFNTTFNTNQATYLAGTQYSGSNTRAQAAGASSTLANTIASGKCRLLAIRDALQAGFPAADASGVTQWITITSYGTGANPIIDASGLNGGIDFPSSCTGGWKIKNVDVKNAICAAIHFDVTSAHGFWIEGCSLHDMDPTNAMPLPPGGADNAPRVAGFTNAWPAGIEILNCSEVYIKNCTVTGTGVPMMVFQNDHTLVEGTTFDTSKYQSVWAIGKSALLPATNIAFVNCRVTNLGTLGWPNGTAGFALTDVDSLILDTCEIDHITHADKDASGIDYEATVTRALMLNCNIHDCYGAPTETTLGGTDGVIYSGCTFANNGTGDTTQKPAAMRQNAIPTYQFWELNTITRAGVGTTQKLFSSAPEPVTYFSDTPPANCYFGSDNTVTP